LAAHDAAAAPIDGDDAARRFADPPRHHLEAAFRDQTGDAFGDRRRDAVAVNVPPGPQVAKEARAFSAGESRATSHGSPVRCESHRRPPGLPPAPR
jgi:hypothetical protein